MVYEWLRIALALSCAFACFRISLSPITWYLLIDAIEHLDPAHLYSAGWWRFVSLPMRVVELVAAFWVTGWLIGKSADLYPIERLYLRLAAGAIGCAIALVGWYWVPQDWFHAVDFARQLIYVGMLVSWASAFVWIRSKRKPRAFGTAMNVVGGGWIAWLMFQVIGATGAGCLVWDLLPWNDGELWTYHLWRWDFHVSGGTTAWYFFSEVSLAGQALIAVWWIVKSRKETADS